MKNRPTLSCVFLLGAILVVGCGGVVPEEMDEMAGPIGEEEQVSSGETEEDQPVNDFSVCCYVACRDGAGERWRGPFSKVKYGNCTEYGRYYCGQHKWSFKASRWNDC